MKERNPSRVNSQQLTVLFSMVSPCFNGSPFSMVSYFNSFPRKHLISSLFTSFSLHFIHSSLNSIHRFRIFLWNILLNHQIVDDEVLALHGILSHIVFQKLLHLVVLMQRNLLQTHIRTYEMSKLLWRNLAETLESGDFRVWSEFTDSLLALFVTITIVGNEIAQPKPFSTWQCLQQVPPL